MIVIAGLVIGALWGGLKAARRKGNRLDIAQYAVAHGIALGLLGMVLTIIVEKFAA